MLKNSKLYILGVIFCIGSNQLIACPPGQGLKQDGNCGPDDGQLMMTHAQLQALGKENPQPNCAHCHQQFRVQ